MIITSHFVRHLIKIQFSGVCLSVADSMVSASKYINYPQHLIQLWGVCEPINATTPYERITKIDYDYMIPPIILQGEEV